MTNCYSLISRLRHVNVFHVIKAEVEFAFNGHWNRMEQVDTFSR